MECDEKLFLVIGTKRKINLAKTRLELVGARGVPKSHKGSLRFACQGMGSSGGLIYVNLVCCGTTLFVFVGFLGG